MNNNLDMIEIPLVQVPVWSLNTAEPFKSLFPVKESVLADIMEDMTVNGFDSSHPIVIWNMTVVDGHCRLKAAIAAGLETVPVVCHTFTDKIEAVEYAIRAQRNRRNLTDYELLQCLIRLDWKKKTGRHQADGADSTFGKSSAIVAETLGISCKKVERLRAINNYATDEIKDLLKQGKISITRAYEEALHTKKTQVTQKLDSDAKLIQSVISTIHAKLNNVQICKLIKVLRTELTID